MLENNIFRHPIFNQIPDRYLCLFSTLKNNYGINNNMADDKTTKNPTTLYMQCLNNYVLNLNQNVVTLDRINIIHTLPPIVLADIYSKMSIVRNLRDILVEELSDLDIFARILRFSPARQQMFRCFASLHYNGHQIATELKTKFTQKCELYINEIIENKKKLEIANSNKNETDNEINTATSSSSSNSVNAPAAAVVTPSTSTSANASTTITPNLLENISKEDEKETDNVNIIVDIDPDNIIINKDNKYVLNDKDYIQQIDFGLRLGSFLVEAGWLDESLAVLTIVLKLIDAFDTDYTLLLIKLDCLQRLLHTQATFCCFKQADLTSNLSIKIVESVGIDKIPNNLLANLYMQISILHFAKHEYNLSYSWAIKALQRVKQNTPDQISIDVLRQAAKSCVVKRQFKRANMLISQAVLRARNSFGKNHQKYADALLDYGFFLLNVDTIARSVDVYMDALEIKRYNFGNRNLHVAVANEDVAYALYVLEYSSGRFQTARDFVEKAIDIMQELVPSNHLMLASAKRVKALILEEIALDIVPSNNTEYDSLLQQSEALHRSALELSLQAFGEINVQTAKHYGNLGRLYQSMMKFDDAEAMHKRAIKIKTDLLGPYDYEVGLSIGHLASLYNYHMKKYVEAEKLYLRSIAISLRLFGDTYSGLEYDYRGLCHVYESLDDTEKYLHYSRLLDEWRVLRHGNGEKTFGVEIKEDTSMEEVTKKFFEMCSENEATTAST